MKEIALGIPAYKAHSTLDQVLSSINIQTLRDIVTVYVVNDDPDGKDYSDITSKYRDLDVKEIRNEVNVGPGQSRNAVIDAATEPYIMFMDADDVLYSPYSIEVLYWAIKEDPNAIQVQGTFLQNRKVDGKNYYSKMALPTHPWSFARLTSLKFLKANGINFGKLRAMEDGRFQWCIRLLVEGSNLKIKYINDPIYVWKEGSDHSITRTGRELNNGIPLYNYGICQIGAAIAAKEAIEFALSKNPFNGNIIKFCAEQMVTHYFTYYECLQNCSMYAETNEWLAKWFYKTCFAKYCATLSYDILEKFYMSMFGVKTAQFRKFPDLTFKQWFERITTQEFDINEIVQIRSRLPEEVVKAEKSTGVLTDNILDMF